jgi:hypothetical protein
MWDIDRSRKARRLKGSLRNVGRASVAFGLGVIAAGAAFAQAGPLPHAFAGYTQPAIGPAACRSANPAETQCVIPAMTAGRYRIEAAATSSAPTVGANQVLQIDVGGVQCGVGRDNAPWTSGSRTFRLDCEVTLLSDGPVPVKVTYADSQATKDPKGPVVTFTALPWNGVLDSQAFAPRQ